MLVHGWTLLAFTCLLIAICLADTSASRLEAMKSQELEAPNKAERVTELKKEEESEGLETRYDRFGRVFKIPYGRVNRELKSSAAEAQVESGSKEKNDGNKKSSFPKPMKIAHEESQAPKDQTKDGGMKKPVRKEGKGRKGAGGTPSDPGMPKPKATTPMPNSRSDGKKGNTSPKAKKIRYGGRRASKIVKKPEVNEKKVGLKDGGMPKDTTIGPNPKVKSVGEKRIESSKPNKIQYGKPQVPRSGGKTEMDKKKSPISTGEKGTPKPKATTPMPKPKNERKTGKTSSTPNKNPHGGSRDSKIGDKEDERKNAGKKSGEGSNHETATRKPPMPFKVGKEGGPSPLDPGSRKTSIPDEPSPIAPDTSFASGNIRSSSDSSPSTTTAAPKKGKKGKKGKKVQDWWSVRRLLLNVASNLTGVLLCAIIHFKWYRVLSSSKPRKTAPSSNIPSAVAGTNALNSPDAGKGPSENKDQNLNEPLPPLDEGSARKKDDLVKMYVAGFENLRAHYKKVTAEHKSDTRTAKFRKMGPIFIPREPPIPPAADLPDNIVLEKVVYAPEFNEIWDIGSDIDDIELDESFHIESYLSETEEEGDQDGGNKNSKKSKKVESKDEKKKTGGNDDTTTAKELERPALAPPASMPTTPAPAASNLTSPAPAVLNSTSPAPAAPSSTNLASAAPSSTTPSHPAVPTSSNPLLPNSGTPGP